MGLGNKKKMGKFFLIIKIWIKSFWLLFKLRSNQLPVLNKHYRKVNNRFINKEERLNVKETIELVSKHALYAIIIFPIDTLCVQRSLVVYTILMMGLKKPKIFNGLALMAVIHLH